MNLLSLVFYRNRQFLTLSLIVVFVSGTSAYLTLPRLEDPRISNRNPLVITRLPGATAERVEALVTKRIETKLRDLSEIKTIESQSRANVSFVQIGLGDSVYDTQRVFAKIRDKLADIEDELPVDATKPELDDERGAVAYSLILALKWGPNGQGGMLNLLNRTAEELADRLRNVSGTDLVRVYGAPDEEIKVELSRDKLAELSLTAEEVAGRISSADVKVAAGTWRSPNRDVVMEVEGAFETTSRLEEVPVINGQHGEVVRLSDIATVSKQWQEPPQEIAIADAERAIYVAVRMLDDRQVDDWMRATNLVLDGFKAGLSPAIQVDCVFQQQQYTKQRLSELGVNLLMGSLVVVFVILVMMGWRSALLVGLALPLVSALVLFSMQLLGIPLHQMSIFGLIVAIGLLIDNAIVVVDDVTSNLRDGKPAANAVAETVGHLFIPLLGSTLTTVFAFLPIFLLPGSVGEFVGTIATTVILALVFSFLISMTIIPALTGLFAKVEVSQAWWRSGIQLPSIRRAFQNSLDFLLKHPSLGLLVAISIPLMGFLRVGELRNEFFPGADRNQFYVQVWATPQSSIQATSETVRKIDREIRRDSRIMRVDWMIGGSMPTVYYNLVMDQDNKPNYAQAIVVTKRIKGAADTINELQCRLDKSFPDSQIVVRQLSQGPPVTAPVEVRIFGPSIARLKSLGKQIQAVLYETPQVLHTRTTFDVSRPKISVAADEAESQLAGLPLKEIAAQLQTTLEGSLGGSMLEGTEVLPVRIRVGSDVRGDLNEIASSRLRVAGSDRWMPLESIADIGLEPIASAIPRRNGERCNTIQAFVEADALPPEVTKEFLDRLEATGIKIPPGYRLQMGGDSEELANSMANLFRYAPVLAVMMLATIVLAFRSFVLAGVIGGVAVLSAGIGFLALWIAGYPLGFNPLIGTAGLIGLAINDSIVVLSQIRSNPKARGGEINAIVAEVMSTGRHVVSTTLTTIGGFIPLLLGGGSFWPPLAIVLAGGVGGATILATIYIPTAYVLLRRWVEPSPNVAEPY